MYKLFKYLLIVIIYCFISRSALAIEYTKSTHNPLPITFNSNYSILKQSHIYKEGSKYKGILTSKRSNENHFSLTSIESDDGISWVMNKEILNNGHDISNGRLFVDKNGNKKILFAGMDSPDYYRIYGIDCDSNLNCEQTPHLVLDPDKTNLLENHGYFAPHIIIVNNHYYFFYGVWGGLGFRVSMAHSDHLGDWQKCKTPIMNEADGPFPYLKGDYLYLFVHRNNGINVLRTHANILGCSSNWQNLGYVLTKTKPYDEKQIIFPSIISDDNQINLYYSGRDANNIWRLSLATGQFSSFPPTPTTIPITPTPTPTMGADKTPVVIIPGMMASWNQEAILHNKTSDQSEWKILPFVQEYKAIINTFKNLGYVEGKDLFIFAYDWRKPILRLIEDFNKYIDVNLSNKKFNIVGHSLGGLIGRVYTQSNNDNVNNIVTAGSPHHGVTQTYKAVEAGIIEQDNSLIWLAQKLFLQLNKNNFQTDKQILNDKFMIIKDLLPTYNYLINNQNNEIDVHIMNYKNDYLLDFDESHNITPDNIFSLSGNNIQTVEKYIVGPQTLLDKLLHNYVDGRPVETINNSGDGLVLTSSANIGSKIVPLDHFDHGQVIYKKESIKKILNSLNISYNDSQIINGTGTTISPSMIFAVQSAAQMEVHFENNIFREENGIIFIPNAQSGQYFLKAKGLSQGKYRILIGQIGFNESYWNTLYGDITSIIPFLETHEYKISFNSDILNRYFVDQDSYTKLIDQLLRYLKLNEKINNDAISRLKVLKNNKSNSNSNVAILSNLNLDFVKSNDFIALDKLENIHGLMIEQTKDEDEILESFDLLKNRFTTLQEKLISKNIDSTAQLTLTKIEEKLNIAENYIIKKDFKFIEAILESIHNLIKTV